MSAFKSWFSIVSYGVKRPYTDIGNSLKSLSSNIAAAKAETVKRGERIRAAKSLQSNKTDAERFEELFETNGWTPDELVQQRKAVTTTKYTLMALAFVGMLSIVALLFFVPVWIMFILGPIGVIHFAGCMAMSVRYAWWQTQIDERKLCDFGVFLGRDDLFSRALRP
jgi:hypothetical protein